MEEVEFTHKGWFGICLIYIAELESDEPVIVERHWLFGPLFYASELLYDVCFFLHGMMDPEFEPYFPLRVTGEL